MPIFFGGVTVPCQKYHYDQKFHHHEEDDDEEADDEEIDDEKRNEVLATAYLIIGEVETALKLLNDKQK